MRPIGGRIPYPAGLDGSRLNINPGGEVGDGNLTRAAPHVMAKGIKESFRSNIVDYQARVGHGLGNDKRFIIQAAQGCILSVNTLVYIVSQQK